MAQGRIVQILTDQTKITFFLIQCNFEKNMFSSKGGTFALALVSQNLHNRNNLQKQISFICDKVPRTEPAPLHVDYRNTLII